jgi:hypothetical protein
MNDVMVQSRHVPRRIEESPVAMVTVVAENQT